MVAFTEIPSLQALMGLDRVPMPPEAARFLLELGLSAADQKRMMDLSAKASAGTLSDTEGQEIDTYLLAADLLTILHSRARMALSRTQVAR
jgi:hypothetical protein